MLNAPVSAVWDLLTDWAGIIDWMPDGYIQSLSCEGQGAGAVRHLVTSKGVAISERLDSLDSELGLICLSIIDPLPWGMLTYSANAQLQARGAHCQLIWRGIFELPASGRQADELANLLKKSYTTMFRGIGNELQRINEKNDSE